jgi:membrane-bound lytic murein transglycosylase A
VPLVKDDGRDRIEPSPTQTAATPDPDPATLTPRGIWLPIDPFLPRTAKAPDADPGAVIPRETGPREGFATKHARYVPVSWEELPGWREGATLGAWNAFAQGCAVLVRRAAWRDTCERASVLRPANPAAAREFFEREFEAFQIRTVDLAETGILTGYFEVSLEGSRVRTIRFRHPVYGVPDDLLFLDARLLTSRRPPVHVRVEGREVVPADEDASSAPVTGSRAVYRLAISRIPAALRDGKLRVRRSGDRIVPYFTRHEIERNGLASAQPIAWVDDPDRLYALHIEGSGRIRLGNGEILRVAFGEQNGHAFRPTISAAPPSAGSGRIERVVDFFVSPAAASQSERSHTLASSVSDPSYIFFRQIPNTNLGPPGAMGVSLTAGSSLAVDPLVTPLGAPVFIAARQSGSGDTMKRLMVAQDTGGAIRGALRADYFLGFGSAAGMMANRMKDELRMWVLLPKHLAIASRHAASARGSGGLNCLLPDQEFCND